MTDEEQVFWDPHFIWLERVIDVLSEGHPDDREALRRGFRKHYEHVRKVVPGDRLLEFHPRNGWAPLCEFLGKDVPDEPFPNLNDAKSLKRFHLLIMPISLYRIAMRNVRPYFPLLLPAAVAAGGAWMYMRKQA